MTKDPFRDDQGNRQIQMKGGKPTYRGYTIEPKKDFGSSGYHVGPFVYDRGYVVTDGGITNVMPGATWFTTHDDAMRAIDDLIASKDFVSEGEHPFWAYVRLRRAAEERALELALALNALVETSEASIEKPLTTMPALVRARLWARKLLNEIDDNCDRRDTVLHTDGRRERLGVKKGGYFSLPMKKKETVS